MGRIGPALPAAILLRTLPPAMDRAASYERSLSCRGDRVSFRHPEHGLQAAKEAGGLGWWQSTRPTASVPTGTLRSTSVVFFCHDAIVLRQRLCCHNYGHPLSRMQDVILLSLANIPSFLAEQASASLQEHFGPGEEIRHV